MRHRADDDRTPEGPVVALVVAAGSGIRLGGEVPKALRTVGGETLIARSVRQLAAGGTDAAVVIVAPGLADEFERALASAPIPCGIVVGGAERQHSVANGLFALAEEGELDAVSVVLIHDAARPLVPAAVVARVVEAVRAGADAVVPVVPVHDTIRQIVAAGSTVIDRASLRAVQTPQGFAPDVILHAHRLLAETGITVTDDAAAAEFIGHSVTLVEGAPEAFKITGPFDLVVAESVLREGRFP